MIFNALLALNCFLCLDCPPGLVSSTRGTELDRLKRDAQMHMQRGLASQQQQEAGPDGIGRPLHRPASPCPTPYQSGQSELQDPMYTGEADCNVVV